MHKILTILLAVATIACIGSCDRPTSSFERDNTNDPTNENYDTGSASEIEISYDSEGIIAIGWQDTAQFEDGFIIEKSLADTSSFKEIGRVDANVTIFRDSSRVVRKNTYYRIVTFKNRDNDKDRRVSSIKKINNLGEITGFNNAFNVSSNSLELSWVIDSPFDKIYRLYYKKSVDPEYQLLGDFSPDIASYTDKLEDISFDDRMYKLELYLVGDNFEDKISESTTVLESTLFEPTDLTVQVQDEQTLALSWQDNSFFEEGFNLYASGELIAQLTPNTSNYQHKIDLTNNRTYSYSLEAFTQGSITFPTSQDKYYTIPTPYLINDKSTNTSGSVINLAWDIDKDELVNEYILERQSSSNEAWMEIERFNKDIKSYTDLNVDPNESYTYRIRTISSDYSKNIELYYRTLFDLITTFQGHSRPISDLDFSPDNNYLISSSNEALGYGDTYLNIWQISTKQLYKRIDGYHNEPLTSVDFSADGTMISSSSWFDATVNIFEFPSGNFQKSFNNVDAYEAEFSPDSKFIAATGGFGDVRKWDVTSGELIFHYEGRGSPTSTPHSIAFKPDGSEIAVDDKSMAIIDSNTGSRIKHLDREYYYDYLGNSVSYNNDGTKLAYTLNSLEVYDTSNWVKLYHSSWQDTNRFPVFHPKNNNVIVVAAGNTLMFKDIESIKGINKFTASNNITSIALSLDGYTVAVGLRDGSIEVWRESTQKAWKNIK